jgi:hypothetical protein
VQTFQGSIPSPTSGLKVETEVANISEHILSPSSVLQMETVSFSEIMPSTDDCTLHQNPDHYPHPHCNEKLKSCKKKSDICTKVI